MKNTTKKKKVLFISRLFYPHIGGVEKHVYSISQELMKKGYDIDVLTEQYDRSLFLEEVVDGINIKRVPVKGSEKNKKFEIWKWILKNRNYIKDFDIVHIHDVFFWLLPIIIGLDRKKIFITFHGYEGYPVKFRHKILRKMAEKACSGNICVGDFMRKWYGTKPTKVIYGACEDKNGNLKDPKDLSALFFGRLDGQTGINEYYSAYQNIKKKYEKFKFAVIGEGEYEKKLKNISISRFKSEVEDEIPTYRFIFVSRYLSMLEAMVKRRIVIAVYDNPIKRDYLVNSPFEKYIDICSTPKQIEESINKYIKNPKLEKKRIEDAYDWAKNQTWKNVLSVYFSLWKI